MEAEVGEGSGYAAAAGSDEGPLEHRKVLHYGLGLGPGLGGPLCGGGGEEWDVSCGWGEGILGIWGGEVGEEVVEFIGSLREVVVVWVWRGEA